MSNFLQALGLQSPGIVADNGMDGGGNPIDLLAHLGVPNYSDPAAVVAPDPSQGGALQAFGDATGSQAAPPPNMLQTLSAPPQAPQPAAPPADAPTRPARSRSSILDAIGRVSDVLAKVGGADPLYQPTLDARQDRVLALGNHDRAVTGDNLDQEAKRADITQTHGAITAAENANIQQAAKFVQAIKAKNPNADVPSIWGVVSRGLPQERADALGRLFAENPGAIDALADGGDDGKGEKYGGNIVYATDANGKLHAFQPGLSSNEGRDILPAGFSATDPLKIVNTGGTTALVGTHSAPRILPNTEKPGAAADRAQRGQIADNKNRTAITIAGMPARTKPGDAKGGGDASNVSALLDNISQGFAALHGMNALPGDNGGVVNNVLGALGRTRFGQAAGEQAGSPAAQKRLEIMKNVSALQQAMLKSLPASATRTRFEQEMLSRGLPDPAKMSLGTANTVIQQLRESFARAQAQSAAGGSASVRPTLRAPARAAKPVIVNW